VGTQTRPEGGVSTVSSVNSVSSVSPVSPVSPVSSVTSACELTVVLPCLYEAETLGVC